MALAGCAAELDFAPEALRSNNRGESDHEVAVSCGTATTPQAPRHRRGHKGVGAGTTRAVAALGKNGGAPQAAADNWLVSSCRTHVLWFPLIPCLHSGVAWAGRGAAGHICFVL